MQSLVADPDAHITLTLPLTYALNFHANAHCEVEIIIKYAPWRCGLSLAALCLLHPLYKFTIL
jgi:hypothetical protein